MQNNVEEDSTPTKFLGDFNLELLKATNSSSLSFWWFPSSSCTEVNEDCGILETVTFWVDLRNYCFFCRYIVHENQSQKHNILITQGSDARNMTPTNIIIRVETKLINSWKKNRRQWRNCRIRHKSRPCCNTRDFQSRRTKWQKHRH